MKKKITSIIIIISLTVLMLPNIASAATENDLISKLGNYTYDAVVKTYYDDFNNDGQYEMFAITGTQHYDSVFEMSLVGGNVWYVSDNYAKNLTEDTKGGVGIIMSGDFEPSYVYTNKGIQFMFMNMWGNGQTVTSVCTVLNDGSAKRNTFGGSLMYGDNGWYVATSTYDITIEKKAFNNGSLFGTGRSWKNYWYFFDDNANEFKEYGGTEITQEQFLQFNGAQDILNLITDGRIYNILYRENGIININIIEESGLYTNNDAYTFSNILVGYDNSSVWTIDNQHSDWAPGDYSPIYSGLYLSALSPDMAVYPEFKKPSNDENMNNDIKIILNGQELTFDQPPINEEGRLLVPIRQIAETMGDTVKWNGDIQTAFVQHRDRALIIPLNIDHLYIIYSDKPVEWNKYTLDVPSQEKNGRTLTPIRAFCESLGATVDYRDDERTAYIHYDYDTNYLPFNSNCISGINMSYAIMRDNNVSFQPYTDEIYNFLEGRSSFLDNLAMSWGNGIFDGFVQLFKGESAMKTAVKSSLASLLADMTNENIYDDDAAEKAIMSTDAIENCSDLIEMINNKDFQKLSDDAKKAKLTEWSETNPELEQFSNIGDIIKWTSFSLEEIQYIFTDYSKNMAYIELLEDELIRYGIEDELIFECISDMKEEYTTGWIGALQNLQDTIVEEGLDEIADTATYGIFSIVNFAKDLTNQLTGLSETADGLYAFYGLCRYSGAIDLAYARALNSVYNDSYNPDSVINLFNIQKAVKTEAYKSMNQIANAVDKVSWDDRINSIKSMIYVLWK